MSWWEWVFSGIGVNGLTQLLRKKEASASVAVQGGKMERSIVATGRNIDQKIELHEHNYPPQGSSSAKKKPLPNFSYVGPQSKFVFISGSPRDGVHEPRNDSEQKDAVYALVLKFTNEAVPGQLVGRAMDVIATIKFRSENRATELRIDYGVWLDSPCVSTDLRRGDTGELLLLIDLPEKSLITLEDKRTDINYPEQSEYLKAKNVTSLLAFIEVILTDRRSQAMLRKTFKVWMQGSRFCVAEI